jgi:hypothetical protein
MKLFKGKGKKGGDKVDAVGADPRPPSSDPSVGADPPPPSSAPSPSPSPSPSSDPAPDEGDSNRVVQSLGDAWAKLIEMVKAVAAWVLEMVSMLPQLWYTMWALICLSVVAVVLLVVLYLVYRIQPRVVGITHSEDLDAHLAAYLTALSGCVDVIHRGHAADAGSWLTSVPEFSGAGGAAADMFASVDALAKRPTLKADVDLYLRFYRALTTTDVFGINTMDIFHNAPALVDADGQVQKEAFMRSVVGPLDRLAEQARTVSDALSAVGLGDARGPVVRAGRVWGKAQVEFAGAVHRLRELLDQRDTIALMGATRRFQATAIWTVYYIPWVMEVFTKLIPAVWKLIPKHVEDKVHSWNAGWESLGFTIAALPCTAAYSSSADRAAKCSTRDGGGSADGGGGDDDGFRGAAGAPEPKASSPAAAAAADAEPVIEGFDFGVITKLASIFVNFGKNIVKLGEAIRYVFEKFPQDPFGTIVHFICIILGTIFGLWFLIMYTVASVFVLFLIPFFAGIWEVWYAWWYTLLLTLYSVWLAIPFSGLWLIDYPSGGVVTKLLRCENSPSEWYNRAGFAGGNGFVRFFGCARPCGSRYRLAWSGARCQRLPDYMPSYCPQQQAMRMLVAKTVPDGDSGPFVMDVFHPSAGFQNKPVALKREALLTAYREKVRWYNACYNTLAPYEYMTRHICSNVDWLGLDPDTKKVLATVCTECCCKFRPDYDPDEPTSQAWRTDNGYQEVDGANNRDACARLAQIVDPSKVAGSSPPPPGPALLRRVLLISLLTLVLLLILYTMIDYGLGGVDRAAP